MAAKSELRSWYESGRDRVVPREPPVPPPNWLRYAIALSRDAEDGLARYLKVVPERFLGGSGAHFTVSCVCGTPDVELEDRTFIECPGGCGRWFVRDAETVWAARLPSEAPDEPAAA
jgi:hypothetical protein